MQTNSLSTDEHYMRMAIDQAYIAEENGDVPIGCVIVHENRVIAKSYNQREQLIRSAGASTIPT